MLGLYIHIPFCVRKCRYCDFLSAPACDSEREAYLKSLHGQIKAIGERLRQKKSGKHYIVDSIFIGGGTPSLLSSDCSPMHKRLIPAILYAQSFFFVTVPGLHSAVISASTAT